MSLRTFANSVLLYLPMLMQITYLFLLLAFILDSIVADPYCLPHPVRWIGMLISFLDNKLCRPEKDSKNLQRAKGLLLCFLVIFISSLVTFSLLFLAYKINFILYALLQIVIMCYCLAARGLQKESKKVYVELKKGNIVGARKALSFIVGRDTENLSQEQIVKATIETVAENASDGVSSPLFFMALFGGVGGIFFKAASTMDSMIGYKNDRYKYFGTVAARLDDVLNFIPARLCAVSMILLSPFWGLDFFNAVKVFFADRNKSPSPNAGQVESVAAGALGLRLNGPAFYQGKLEEKPYLGIQKRETQIEDILAMNRLMYASNILILLLLTALQVLLGQPLQGLFLWLQNLLA